MDKREVATSRVLICRESGENSFKRKLPKGDFLFVFSKCQLW